MIEAIILITAPAKYSGGIVEILKEIPQIVEVGALYGDIDVYAKVSVESMEALENVVMNRIQNIDTVTSTRTLLIIPSYTWKK